MLWFSLLVILPIVGWSADKENYIPASGEGISPLHAEVLDNRDEVGPSPVAYGIEFDLSALHLDERIYLTRSQLHQFIGPRKLESPALWLPRNSSRFLQSAYSEFQYVDAGDLYHLWESTVALEMTYVDDAKVEKSYPGSGFFINGTHIATAGHNVDGCLDENDMRCSNSSTHKYYLDEVSVCRSHIFFPKCGDLVTTIWRPATDIPYEWTIHPRDLAILAGPTISSRRWVDLQDFDASDIVGKDLLVAGYPPRFRPTERVDLPRDSVRGSVLNQFYGGGLRRVVTKNKVHSVSASQNVLTHRNPTYGGFSGGPVCIVKNERIECIAVHVGGGYLYNSAITSKVSFFQEVMTASDDAPALKSEL